MARPCPRAYKNPCMCSALCNVEHSPAIVSLNIYKPTQFYIPVSEIQQITQLALRHWPNVGPTSTLTLGQRRLTNVGPMWICQLPNVGPTLCQHRPNVGTLMLGQRWHNITPMVVCQRCTNIGPTGGCVTGFLWGEPIGHRWIPLTKGQERWRWCLPKQSVE